MNALPPPTERVVHRAILKMIKGCFPNCLVHHSPNGAHLAGGASSRFKQVGALIGDGMVRGFPDLAVFWAPAKGCFLEIKRPKIGKLSDAQKDVHERLDAICWPVAVVTAVDEAYMFLRRLGAPWNGVDPRRNKVQDEYHLGPVPEPCDKCGWLYGHAEGCK